MNKQYYVQTCLTLFFEPATLKIPCMSNPKYKLGAFIFNKITNCKVNFVQSISDIVNFRLSNQVSI